MFESPEQVLSGLGRVGYLTDRKTATTIYLAGAINKPVLLEGPAGAGKTELAQSLARAARAQLLRLQCYQGINEEKAIGQFDRSLQELFVLLKTKAEGPCDWEQIRRDVTSRAFFLAGPLLAAIEQDERCVLLIDEIDKVDYAFEAVLLELLSAWTLSIPKMGTVKARTIPFVFMTSNQERRLGDPLRRRCFYLIVDHPTAEREAAIVKNKTPKASAATHRFIAGLAAALRSFNLEKPPSISEMNDVAQAMQLLAMDEILTVHKDIMLPLIVKTEGDRKRMLMKQAFEVIIHTARKNADAMEAEEVRATIDAIEGQV